jgi:UDP-2,4-diacetamido-2,4,6-trideoxy-beta-L-altropyranose hydrolase
VKVGIRVDASPAIGLGHVKRCVALALALRDIEVDVRFVTRDLGPSAKRLIGSAGFHCVVLPGPSTNQRDDARATCDALQSEHADWVVVDDYGLDAVWHRIVASSLSTRIAAIDDLGNRPLAVDLVIDHNLADHRRKYQEQLPQNVPILGGPHYALLDPAYGVSARYEYSEEVRTIGIFMGGIDIDDFSSIALEACRGVARFTGAIEVVTTQDNPNLRSLEALASRGGRTDVLIDLPNLADFFRRHDLQIGAGGGATWERCCIGVPTLAVAVAENQRYVLEPLGKRGAVRAVSERVPTADSLGREIRYLIDSPEVRSQLAQTSRQLVDGRGAFRVADAMESLCIK